MGVGEKEQLYKNVNLLISAYIAVHLKCCCYANTLGVYFLNPSEELPVSWPPAVSFEYGAAAADTAATIAIVSVLLKVCVWGKSKGGERRLNHQSSQMQSSKRPFSVRLSKNDTN